MNFNELISTQEARLWLEDSVDKDCSKLVVCSAFLTLGALEYFYHKFIDNKFSGECEFLARWRLDDLLNGASSLEVFKFLQERNIPLYIKNDFHGKIYSVGGKGLLIGSHNFTRKGLGLASNSNDEFGVILEESSSNNQIIEKVFSNSTLVTQSLYEEISQFILTCSKSKNESVAWPDSIKAQLERSNLDHFLINEWLHSKNPLDKNTQEYEHDLSLLNLNSSNDMTDIKNAFCESIPYRWLSNVLSSHNNEIYHGELGSLLHDAFIDDPRPYRKDVKQLLNNLLSWIKILDIEDIKIDRPSHSERISRMV